MIKKLLGTIAGGVMMFSGGVSHAAVIDMSGQYTENAWTSYTYSGFSSGFSGNVWIGVANQADDVAGGSILNIDNVAPYTSSTLIGAGSGSGAQYSLSTDGATGDCSTINGFPSFIGLVGGSCSYVSFAVDSISSIAFDWMMGQWDGFDFAFVAWEGVGDNAGTAYSEVILTNPDAKPPTIPEPSSLALMALGLLGAGTVARRNQKKIA